MAMSLALTTMRHFCKFLIQSLKCFKSGTNGGVRRFLRARRFHVDDAIQQFKATEEWRASTQLDLLYNTIDLQQYDETRRLVSCFPTLPALLLASRALLHTYETYAHGITYSNVHFHSIHSGPAVATAAASQSTSSKSPISTPRQ